MIPVEPQPEPANFHKNVTEKALLFLEKNPLPARKEIAKNPFWRNSLDDLHKAYRKICSYTGLWCSRDAAAVDHFVPIYDLVPGNPEMIYEWSNFRLASRSMNTEKNKYRDVLDPFLIKPGWFVLHFPSLVVGAGSGLTGEQDREVKDTISRLKLNRKEKYFQYRQEFLIDYCELCVGLDNIKPALRHLEKKAPFIAYELRRQGLTEKIVDMMKYPKRAIKKNA